MLEIGGAGKKCLKCEHTRTAGDPLPDDACPKCGAIYRKVEEALRAKEAARIDAKAAVREAAEQRAWEKEHFGELRAARARESNLRLTAHIAYALFILPLGTGLIGLIMAYGMRAQAMGSWVQSHFEWQIGTFWRGLVLLVLVVVLGKFVLFGGLIAASGRAGPPAWVRSGARSCCSTRRMCSSACGSSSGSAAAGIGCSTRKRSAEG